MDGKDNIKTDNRYASLIPPREEMEVLARKYPWFDAARRAASHKNDYPIHIVLKKGFRRMVPAADTPAGESLVSISDIEKELTLVEKRRKTPGNLENIPHDGHSSGSGEDCKTVRGQETEGEGASTLDIIDSFMAKGEHKITPQCDTPDYIPEINFPELPDDDDLITEELAEVYFNQGLFAQAKVIYERLSLLYPKKSIYFAEIIEKITPAKDSVPGKKD